jgi:hypothetical protein
MSSEGAYEITLDGSELVSDGASFLFCARLLLVSFFSFAGTLVIYLLFDRVGQRTSSRRTAASSTANGRILDCHCRIAEVGLAIGWRFWRLVGLD